MKLLTWLIATPLLLFFIGCTPDKQSDPSDHLLKEQKQALDKAREVDRLAEKAAELQRQALQETR